MVSVTRRRRVRSGTDGICFGTDLGKQSYLRDSLMWKVHGRVHQERRKERAATRSYYVYPLKPHAIVNHRYADGIGGVEA